MLRKYLLLSVVMLFAGDVYAGSASAKLSALADSLIKDYAAKGGAVKTTLAVFPLNCEPKLEKQRVGFAASEVMAHRFVADASFTVVERGEIGKLLSEQRLQASGAVDSGTAVRLGKLVGAGVVLLGNIQKVDGQYQVNARLVNAETSEVLVSGYAELDAGAFEDDARVYLNLVPQEQAIGIYAVFNYRYNRNNKPAFVEVAPNNETTFKPRGFSSLMAGGGLLYRPSRHIQINAELTTSSLGKDGYITRVSSYTGGYAGPSVYTEKQPLEMTMLSMGVVYVSELRGKWWYSAGLGLQNINAAVSNEKENPPVGAFVKAGLEFKPQSRVGFGLNIKYELRRTVFRSETSDNVLLKLNPLSVESVLALYF